MSPFVANRYDELVARLALGLEPLDALTGERVPFPLDVRLRGEPYRPRRLPGDPQPLVRRRGSCRYVLLYGEAPAPPLEVRVFDRARRYVARRLEIPIAGLAAVRNAEAVGADIPVARRVRRPVLFPGAAYPVPALATGLRGRVERGGGPVAWARVTARLDGRVVGRGETDDRGEFLLVLRPLPSLLATLPQQVRVTLRVVAPDPAEPIDPDDPAAAVPLEPLAAPGAPDPVAAGAELAGPYDPGVAASFPDVPVPLGRVTSVPAAFDL